MSFLELSDYSLPSGGLGNGINPCFFTAHKGDVWKIESDNINDSHLLINGIATLSYPVQGSYTFDGNKLDFSDYRNLLSIKKRIGYIASDATLISNRTIRENLVLKRIYFENDLSPELKAPECSVCDIFDIEKALDVRPSELKAPDIKKVILIRELLKQPDIILIEYPDEFSGYNAMDDMVKILQQEISRGAILIYASQDPDFTREFSHNTLTIEDGWLTKTYCKSDE